MELSNSNNDIIPWESWIDRENVKSNFVGSRSFDRLCELAVNSYDLDAKSRNPELKDKMHFFIVWWSKNTGKMKVYKSYSSIGKLLKKHHSTISFYISTRIESYNFDQNTEDIKDFLES